MIKNIGMTLLIGASLSFAAHAQSGVSTGSGGTVTPASTTMGAGQNVNEVPMQAATPASQARRAGNVVEKVVGTRQFTMLANALERAGLAAKLAEGGPYTVFAPVNDAFEALPKAQLEGLMKAENKEQLVSLLAAHVVAGKVKADDLQDGQTLETLAGNQLKVSKRDGRVTVGGAPVGSTDMEASNGIIHGLGAVIMPMAQKKMQSR